MKFAIPQEQKIRFGYMKTHIDSLSAAPRSFVLVTLKWGNAFAVSCKSSLCWSCSPLCRDIGFTQTPTTMYLAEKIRYYSGRDHPLRAQGQNRHVSSTWEGAGKGQNMRWILMMNRTLASEVLVYYKNGKASIIFSAGREPELNRERKIAFEARGQQPLACSKSRIDIIKYRGSLFDPELSWNILKHIS